MIDPTKPHQCVCGSTHRLRPYKHRLSPELVIALRKFKQAVLYYKRVELHVRKELLEAKGAPFQFTYDEYSNVTKLRFHGLLVKREGKKGIWVLAHRGNQFLKGEIWVPRWVKTVDNRVVQGPGGHSEEKVHISQFKDVRELAGFGNVSTPEGPVERKPVQATLA